jgi:predicted transcriptional regulator
MAKKRKPVSETEYRASRFFRLLGNPDIYLLVKEIGNRKIQPKELAKKLGKNKSTISYYLRTLKAIDVVRYKTYGKLKKGYYTLYWLKDETVLDILKDAEKFIEKMRKGRNSKIQKF